MLYCKSRYASLRRSLSVFIFLFVVGISIVRGQVREVYRTAAYEEILSYSFGTPAEGYATFRDHNPYNDHNMLAYTGDSGRTFMPIAVSWTNTNRNGMPVDTTAEIRILTATALSAKEVLLTAEIGRGDALLLSIDKGKTFRIVFAISSSVTFYDIRVNPLPGTNTVVILDGWSTHVSTDRGQTWKKVTDFAYQSRIGKLFAFSAVYVFACNVAGDNPVLYKSMADSTFRKMPIPADWSNAQFSMVSPSKGWAFVSEPVNGVNYNHLYVTLDSGYTWNKTPQNGSYIDSLLVVNMINDTLGFGAAQNNKLYKTIDGGVTWLRIARTSTFSERDWWGEDCQFKTMGNDYMWVSRKRILEMSNNGGGPAMMECLAASFSPLKARAGDPIIIKGDNFTIIDSVTLGGSRAASWQVINKNTLRVVAGSGTSGDLVIYTPVNTVSLKGYRAIPTFSDVFPKMGTTNTHVVLQGTSLTSVTQVKVGNIPAKAFKILGNDSIQISVPYTTNGIIQLIGPDTVITTNLFHYYRGPVISGISPLEGPVGTTVTITGANFGSTPDSNIVYFGGIRGQVISATSTSIKVKVPTGAPYKNISVTKGSLTATSPYAFNLTFPNGGSINPLSFGSAQSFDAGGLLQHPGRTAIADLDGDGKPDLITPDTKTNQVVISRNNSNGGIISFTDHEVITAGLSAPNALFKVVTADVNNDGKIDLSIGNNADGNTYIYINTSTPGDISYKPIPAIPGILLEVADINQDGRPDLVQRIENDAVVRTNYSESGTTSFENSTVTAFTYYESSIWDASAITLFGRPQPTLLFSFPMVGGGTGIYNYSLPDSLVLERAGVEADNDPVAGDYNKDGLFDYGTVNYGRSVAIASSTPGDNEKVGELNMIELKDFSSAPLSQVPTRALLQDMDGDGRADVLHGIKDAKKMYLYHNIYGEGAGYFATGTVLKLNNPVAYFTVADLDGDNKRDILLLDTVVNKLLLYQNNCTPKPYIDNCLPANGNKGDTITLKGLNFSQVSGLMLGDQPAPYFKVVDASTIVFVVGNRFTGNIQVTNSAGTGTWNGFSFGRAPVIQRISPLMGPVGTEVTITGENFSAVASENTVNFSGVTAEVISATTTALKVKVPAHTSTGPISVTSGQHVGEYTEFFRVTFPGPKKGFSTSTFDLNLRLHGRAGGVLMDMDNDGKQDIITHDYDNLIIYRNTSTPGKMQFDEPFFIPIKGKGFLNPLKDTAEWVIIIGTPTPLSNPAVMDLNTDGKPDIAIYNPENSQLYIYLNNSTTGSIQLQSPYTVTSPNASCISIHDFDGDGKPDIIHASPDGVRMFRNTGAGNTFSLDDPVAFREFYSHGPDKIKTLAFADINKDGKIDVYDGRTVYYNNSIPGRINVSWNKFEIGARDVVVALNDWNNNDKVDVALVAADRTGNFDLILDFCKNNVDPDGSVYGRPFEYDSYGFVPLWANQIAPGDFDGDGLPDLLMNHSALGGKGSLMKNVSTSDSIRFLPFVPVRNGVDGSGWAAVGDLDGDSKPDLVLFGNRECGTWVSRNRYDEVANLSLCNGVDTSITSNISGNKYQWQVLKTGGDFTDIFNDTLYANTTGKTLQLKHVGASINGFTYRCLVDNNPGEYTGIQVTPNTFPFLDLDLADMTGTYCPGTRVVLRTTAYAVGDASEYQWWMDDSVRLNNKAPNYVVDTLTENHRFQAKIISKGVCPDKAIAESRKLEVNVLHPELPQVLLTSNATLTCSGNDATRYTFTAVTQHVEAYNKPSYKWYYNGSLVPNETGLVLTKTGLHTGDSIYTTMSVEEGFCITGRDYKSNTITMTKGNTTAASGKLVDRSSSDCADEPKQLVFTSATIDAGSKIEFYETDEKGDSRLLETILFVRDSVVYKPNAIFDNATHHYFCKVVPAVGSCQQTFISNTILLRWYQWIKPVLQIDGTELVVINSTPGTVFKWKNVEQDTASYPAVSTGTNNRYTPVFPGRYKVEAILGTCYSLSDPVYYGENSTIVSQHPIIRPNPVSDVLIMDQIKLTDNWTTLEILDSYGTPQLPLINVTGKSSVTVNTAKLGGGIYFAVLKRNDNKNITVKFVKVN
ncbi:MAG: VCBS repeat-containing protein [Chitinophaga sp.]|uniref:FG-GAP-like repeat-containing protein n=1 Tax=Chitinophaga sp. TaxID=1869181 RepID=UPI001B19A369|nr:FG-GAP-like repeat-containing protein [Chitinophaga sp.]MBO9728661.1 VCBS repeat-containing protein [Chitinophaga sp.]